MQDKYMHGRQTGKKMEDWQCHMNWVRISQLELSTNRLRVLAGGSKMIKAVPLSRRNIEDNLIWNDTTDGRYPLATA